ncbi:MAG: HAD family hydrolase [Spirochaetales bacterium]
METSGNLKEFKPERSFFIGIDSDGTVFDSMELKHKECFCPAFINHFELQCVSRYARETWEFVNLYSRYRGCNRFHAVLKSLDLLRERPEVLRRNAPLLHLPRVEQWVQHESRLGLPSLQEEMRRAASGEEKAQLERVYRWSLDVNDAVKRIVRNLTPFPFFRESLDRIADEADAMVISQTPTETLVREWAELGLAGNVRRIAGQEWGSKADQMRDAAGGKYALDHILLIGDAPGDAEAAKDVGALFYPIIPGREEESWERFLKEGFLRFLQLEYRGAYQEGLLDEFYQSLPELPPWKNLHKVSIPLGESI